MTAETGKMKFEGVMEF